MLCWRPHLPDHAAHSVRAVYFCFFLHTTAWWLRLPEHTTAIRTAGGRRLPPAGCVKIIYTNHLDAAVYEYIAAQATHRVTNESIHTKQNYCCLCA